MIGGERSSLMRCSGVKFILFMRVHLKKKNLLSTMLNLYLFHVFSCLAMFFMKVGLFRAFFGPFEGQKIGSKVYESIDKNLTFQQKKKF